MKPSKPWGCRSRRSFRRKPLPPLSLRAKSESRVLAFLIHGPTVAFRSIRQRPSFWAVPWPPRGYSEILNVTVRVLPKDGVAVSW
jgi:hypothetical protein